MPSISDFPHLECSIEASLFVISTVLQEVPSGDIHLKANNSYLPVPLSHQSTLWNEELKTIGCSVPTHKNRGKTTDCILIRPVPCKSTSKHWKHYSTLSDRTTVD